MTRWTLLVCLVTLLALNSAGDPRDSEIEGKNGDDDYEDEDTDENGVLGSVSKTNVTLSDPKKLPDRKKFPPQRAKQKIWREIRREVRDMRKNILPGLAGNISWMEVDVRDLNRNFYSMVGDIRFMKNEVLYIKQQAHVIWENVTDTRRDHKRMNKTLWWILNNVTLILSDVEKSLVEINNMGEKYVTIGGKLDEAVGKVTVVSEMTNTLSDMNSTFRQLKNNLNIGTKEMSQEINIVQQLVGHLAHTILDIKNDVVAGFLKVDQDLILMEVRILGNVSDLNSKIINQESALSAIIENLQKLGQALYGFSERIVSMWNMVVNLNEHLNEIAANILSMDNHMEEFGERLKNVDIIVTDIQRKIDDMGTQMSIAGTQFIGFVTNVDRNFDTVNIHLGTVHERIISNVTSVRGDLDEMKGQLREIRQVIAEKCESACKDGVRPTQPGDIDIQDTDVPQDPESSDWPQLPGEDVVTPTASASPIYPQPTVYPTNGYPPTTQPSLGPWPTTTTTGYPSIAPEYPHPSTTSGYPYPFPTTTTPGYPYPSPTTTTPGSPHPSTTPEYPHPTTPSNGYPYPTTPSNGYPHPTTPSNGYPYPTTPPNGYPYPTTPPNGYPHPTTPSNGYPFPTTPSNGYPYPTTPSNGYPHPTTPSNGYPHPTTPPNGYPYPTTPSNGYPHPTTPSNGYPYPTTPPNGYPYPTTPSNGYPHPTTPSNGYPYPTTPPNGYPYPTTPSNGHPFPTTPPNGYPYPTTPSNGYPHPTTPSNGYPYPTTPSDGYPYPTTPSNGYPWPTTPSNGYPYPTTPSNGYPHPTTPSNGYPYPTTPPNGYPYPTTPSNGYPDPTTPPNGYPHPTTPSNGYPHPTTPPDGYPYPTTPSNGYPHPTTPNGYPHLTTPPNGYPHPTTPSNGYPHPTTPPDDYPYPTTPSNGYPHPTTPPNGYPHPTTPSNGYPYPTTTPNGHPYPTTPSNGYPHPTTPSNGYPYPTTPSNGHPYPTTPSNGYPYPTTPPNGYPYPTTPSNGYPHPTTPSNGYPYPTTPPNGYPFPTTPPIGYPHPTTPSNGYPYPTTPSNGYPPAYPPVYPPAYPPVYPPAYPPGQPPAWPTAQPIDYPPLPELPESLPTTPSWPTTSHPIEYPPFPSTPQPGQSPSEPNWPPILPPGFPPPEYPTPPTYPTYPSHPSFPVFPVPTPTMPTTIDGAETPSIVDNGLPTTARPMWPPVQPEDGRPMVPLPIGPHGPGLPIGCDDQFTGYCACSCPCDCNCPTIPEGAILPIGTQVGGIWIHGDKNNNIGSQNGCNCVCTCPCPEWINGLGHEPGRPMLPPWQPPPIAVPLNGHAQPTSSSSPMPPQYLELMTLCFSLLNQVVHEIAEGRQQVASIANNIMLELDSTRNQFFNEIQKVHQYVQQELRAFFEGNTHLQVEAINLSREIKIQLKEATDKNLMALDLVAFNIINFQKDAIDALITGAMGNGRAQGLVNGAWPPVPVPGYQFPEFAPPGMPPPGMPPPGMPPPGMPPPGMPPPSYLPHGPHGHPEALPQGQYPVQGSPQQFPWIGSKKRPNETATTPTEVSTSSEARRMFSSDDMDKTETEYSTEATEGVMNNSEKGCIVYKKHDGVDEHLHEKLTGGVDEAVNQNEDNDNPMRGHPYDADVMMKGMTKMPNTEIMLPEVYQHVIGAPLNQMAFHNLLQKQINDQLMNAIPPGILYPKKSSYPHGWWHGPTQGRYQLPTAPLFPMIPGFPSIHPPMTPSIPLVSLSRPPKIRPPTIPNLLEKLPPGTMTAAMGGFPYSVSYNDGKGNSWNVNINRRNYFDLIKHLDQDHEQKEENAKEISEEERGKEVKGEMDVSTEKDAEEEKLYQNDNEKTEEITESNQHPQS